MNYWSNRNFILHHLFFGTELPTYCTQTLVNTWSPKRCYKFVNPFQSTTYTSVLWGKGQLFVSLHSYCGECELGMYVYNTRVTGRKKIDE